MRSSGSNRRGQTLPMFAIALVAVLGFAGLALDGSRLYAEHERVQRAADAAAIAAAHELRRGNHDYSRDLLPAATHDAGLQGVSPTDAEIIVHHPPVSGAYASSPDHVEVSVRVQLPNTFMAMFGRASQPVSARAVAGLTTSDPPCLAALASSGAATVAVEGVQPLQIECDVAVASPDPAAWSVAGATLPEPPSVQVRDSLGDLVSGLRMPGCVGRSPGVAEASEDGLSLYWPGCYAEPVEIRSGRAQLMPGVHIFQRGLRIEGGVVVGRGVALLFPASPEQTGVEILAGASVELTAPERGEMQDIVLFAEQGGPEWSAVIERSADSVVQGGLMFPGRALRWAPNAPGAGAWVRVAADRITILEGPGGRAILAPPAETSTQTLAVLVE